jgi:hypothetical protein
MIESKYISFLGFFLLFLCALCVFVSLWCWKGGYNPSSAGRNSPGCIAG